MASGKRRSVVQAISQTSFIDLIMMDWCIEESRFLQTSIVYDSGEMRGEAKLRLSQATFIEVILAGGDVQLRPVHTSINSYCK